MHHRFIHSAFYDRHKRKILRLNEMITLVTAIALLAFLTGDETYQAKERRFMISEIQMTAFVTGLHTGLYKIDEKVLNVMGQIPRTNFLDSEHSFYAYKNVALPMVSERYIIPEPFLTAMMIHLMGVHKADTVLEIGYGTGYEAAILSKLAKKVYTIKQQNPLGKASEASNVENSLAEYRNVQSVIGNGIHGWPRKAPFDAILVKQAISDMPPQALIDQLTPYGRLVIPIEDSTTHEQRVMVYLKMPDGSVQSRETLYVKMTHLLPGQDI